VVTARRAHPETETETETETVTATETDNGDQAAVRGPTSERW
jgi:hypothetical protein